METKAEHKARRYDILTAPCLIAGSAAPIGDARCNGNMDSNTETFNNAAPMRYLSRNYGGEYDRSAQIG